MGEVELFFAAKLLLSVFNTVCVCAKACVCLHNVNSGCHAQLSSQ